MGIDIFSRGEFEAALPDKAGWQALGLVSGEYSYIIVVSDDVVINIRSSVRENGLSASTGKDSIRCWLSTPDGTPVGNKSQAYVTRLPGWQGRLLGVLRDLWSRGKKVTRCSCGRPMGVFKVRKAGPNKGRTFQTCRACNSGFAWLS